MRRTWMVATGALAAVLAAAPWAIAQNENEGQGQVVVTALPKNEKQPSADVAQQAIRELQVNGKKANVTNWTPMRGQNAGVELVLLIDGGARTSLGRELDDISKFVRSLPPNVKIALAYMENGTARMAGPLTADHAQAAQELHLPMGIPGYSASPYFCLSALAKNWPSHETEVRREVIMITDGVDYYHMHYDPDDPYVQTAMDDAARANLVVYSIYWKSTGPADRTWYETNAGQNLLQELTQSTGGNSYWIGFGNPVSLTPYFDDFSRRLNNQYELGFAAPLKGNKPELEQLRLKIDDSKVKVDAPQRVLVGHQGANSGS